MPTPCPQPCPLKRKRAPEPAGAATQPAAQTLAPAAEPAVKAAAARAMASERASMRVRQAPSTPDGADFQASRRFSGSTVRFILEGKPEPMAVKAGLLPDRYSSPQ